MVYWFLSLEKYYLFFCGFVFTLLVLHLDFTLNNANATCGSKTPLILELLHKMAHIFYLPIVYFYVGLLIASNTRKTFNRYMQKQKQHSDVKHFCQQMEQTILYYQLIFLQCNARFVI